MSTGLRFTLEVDGLPPDAFAVVSFHLNQLLSSLFSLDLSLVSQQFLSLEFAQVLDKMAYLTIWQGDEVQRRVPGQQYDEESGLYYNRNRYYDPLQGRYITQDPIGLRGEWNLYKYPLNPVRFIDSLGLKFHVNGDPSDFNQAVEYLKQDSQMKETIDFLSSSEETINIEYIEGTNVRFNSNNMAIYWNSRASLFCSTELNSKSQSPALGLGHEFAHAQYYLLDKENFMALLSRTDKKYENKEEARVITIIESRAAKTLGECTRGAHSGLPFYRVDGPLQTMKITGTPE
ncbi:TPA: RHS repeat-associated core domain-containing protein [Escherichia coli]|nr:RHS repeat protein [Escherichia coli]MGQ60493.1 RHS repeat protein [Escherichia coli]